MKKLLFSAEGRIGRGTFWKATLGSVFGALAVATLLGYLVIQLGPNEAGPDGGFQVNGLNAVPFFTVVFASLIFIGWSSICLGIKRYHDRDKPGIWVILSLIPFANMWYFVETGFLPGTVGPNTFGPDPRGRSVVAPAGFSPAV